MTITDVYQMLNSIDAFTDKVTYYAWKENEVPELPFICYLETNTNNFLADNRVYQKLQGVEIELYTRNKDIVSETLIETALNENNIIWNKTEDYINSEKCFLIVYEITI